jgi:hypothetical protein
VWLEEFADLDPKPHFNLKHFSWKKPKLKLEEFLGYGYHSILKLHKSYGVGLEINGELVKKGDPILEIECDISLQGTPVTSIKYK